MGSPHDTLFRLAFGRMANARDLLRTALPPALVAAIDWRSLRRIDASFVDRRLRKSQADLLFSAKVHGRRVLLYVLIEHKSTGARLAVLQLLGYQIAIWQRHHRDHPRQPRLPPILPFVLHHGATRFSSPTSLRELLDLAGLPDELVALQPDFTFALDDLTTQSEQQLADRTSSTFARLALLCMQHVQTGKPDAVGATLRGWAELLERLRHTQSGQDDLLTLYSYLFEVAGLPDEQLRTILTEVTPRSTHKMITAAEHIRRRTRKEVKPKYVAQGQARGLLRQLTKKFGPLPPALVARIKRARIETLDGWCDQFVTARKLDDVFAEA